MRTKLTALLVCLCLAVAAKAQFLPGNSGKRHVLCDVIMKDGSSFKDYEIDLPRARDKKIKINKGKEKLTLQSEDVATFTAWHENSPESKFLFKYIMGYDYAELDGTVTFLEGKSRNVWIVLEADGPFMQYWWCMNKLKISKKGTLIGYASDQIDQFLWKKGDKRPKFVPWVNNVRDKKYRQYLQQIVKDDPALVKELDEAGWRKGNYGWMKEKGLDELVKKYYPVPAQNNQ